jgi:hypothetical protein
MFPAEMSDGLYEFTLEGEVIRRRYDKTKPDSDAKVNMLRDLSNLDDFKVKLYQAQEGNDRRIGSYYLGEDIIKRNTATGQELGVIAREQCQTMYFGKVIIPDPKHIREYESEHEGVKYFGFNQYVRDLKAAGKSFDYWDLRQKCMIQGYYPYYGRWRVTRGGRERIRLGPVYTTHSLLGSDEVVSPHSQVQVIKDWYMSPYEQDPIDIILSSRYDIYESYTENILHLMNINTTHRYNIAKLAIVKCINAESELCFARLAPWVLLETIKRMMSEGILHVSNGSLCITYLISHSDVKLYSHDPITIGYDGLVYGKGNTRTDPFPEPKKKIRYTLGEMLRIIAWGHPCEWKYAGEGEFTYLWPS